MKADKLTQEFWMSGKRQVGAWHRYLKLATFSLIGVVIIIAASVLRKTPAVAAFLTEWRFDPAANQLDITLQAETTPRYFLLAEPPRIVVDLPDTQLGGVETQQTYSGVVRQVRVSQFQDGITRIVLELSPEVVLSPEQVQLQQVGATEWVLRPLIAQIPTEPVSTSLNTLPPANLPVDQSAVVNVPPVNRTEALIPTVPTAAIPPATLPPIVSPTDQTPAVSVPSLEPIPAQTPTPVTTSQPLAPQPESISSDLSSSSVIEFGQSLPKTTPALTPQTDSPTLDSVVAVDAPETAPIADNPDLLIPAGTLLTLRFAGEKALNLQTYQLRQEVLVLEEDLRDRTNQIIAPAGTPIIGHFETSSNGTRFIAQAITLNGKNVPFEAQSDILSNQQPAENLDASLPPIYPNPSPALTIQPGQVLQIQLQSDWPN